MAISKGNYQEKIKVTFSLEERPLTYAQKEAGRRLFKKLVAREKLRDGYYRIDRS